MRFFALYGFTEYEAGRLNVPLVTPQKKRIELPGRANPPLLADLLSMLSEGESIEKASRNKNCWHRWVGTVGAHGGAPLQKPSRPQ